MDRMVYIKNSVLCGFLVSGLSLVAMDRSLGLHKRNVLNTVMYLVEQRKIQQLATKNESLLKEEKQLSTIELTPVCEENKLLDCKQEIKSPVEEALVLRSELLGENLIKRELDLQHREANILVLEKELTDKKRKLEEDTQRLYNKRYKSNAYVSQYRTVKFHAQQNNRRIKLNPTMEAIEKGEIFVKVKNNKAHSNNKAQKNNKQKIKKNNNTKARKNGVRNNQKHTTRRK